MNPGIFYLYEYENNRRRRNVGFIKISRRYQTCILQIHARGVSAGNGAPLELYAFYRDGDAMTGTQIATLTCFGKTVSVRLPVSERSFPEGRPLSEMDGFLIKLPGEKTAVFWMASAFFFPVDIGMLRPPISPEGETEEPAVPAPESDRTEEPGSDMEEAVPEESSPVPENEKPREPESGPESNPPLIPIPGPGNDTSQEPAPVPESTEPREPESGPENIAPEVPEQNEESEEPEAPSSALDGAETPSGLSEDISGQEKDAVSRNCCSPDEKKKARKIQRSDISILPRRFWSLANNSFLLHGYHNYNHLLLAEEAGRLWLGVPGIYDPREARAADLFGFPQFTREYAAHLDLEPEECSDSDDFGYWCRCVGTGRIE